MNPIFKAATAIQEHCHSRNWRFCFIGALAVQRWGEPRLTQDVDLTILSGFGRETEYIEDLLRSFQPRIWDAQEFALENRVLLLELGGIPIDVSLGALPFEQRVIERASPFQIEKATALITCSAEDLVVLKAFAGRDKDWLDIEGILLRQAGKLDQELVRRELAPLLELKGDNAAMARLNRTLADTR